MPTLFPCQPGVAIRALIVSPGRMCACVVCGGGGEFILRRYGAKAQSIVFTFLEGSEQALPVRGPGPLCSRWPPHSRCAVQVEGAAGPRAILGSQMPRQCQRRMT